MLPSSCRSRLSQGLAVASRGSCHSLHPHHPRALHDVLAATTPAIVLRLMPPTIQPIAAAASAPRLQQHQPVSSSCSWRRESCPRPLENLERRPGAACLQNVPGRAGNDGARAISYRSGLTRLRAMADFVRLPLAGGWLVASTLPHSPAEAVQGVDQSARPGASVGTRSKSSRDDCSRLSCSPVAGSWTAVVCRAVGSVVPRRPVTDAAFAVPARSRAHSHGFAAPLLAVVAAIPLFISALRGPRPSPPVFLHSTQPYSLDKLQRLGESRLSSRS